MIIALTFVTALLVYCSTMAHTVTFVDAGEMILASATLGVPHPPGFPLYVLLGHLFTKLPVGTMAERVVGLSAVSAAAAAAFVAAAAVELRKTVSTSEAAFAERLVPIAVGLSFAFSATLWRYAAVAEVYGLSTALVAAVLWLVLRRRRIGSDPGGLRDSVPWCLPAAGLFFGLALGVHSVTVALTLPGLAWIVGREPGLQALRPREKWLAGAGVLAGLGAYVYLPLAASSGPLYNWGDPSTPSRFLRHVLATEAQAAIGIGDLTGLGRQVAECLGLVAGPFTGPGLAFVGIGFVVLRRRDRDLWRGLLLIVAANVLFSVSFRISDDKDAYYLTTHLALIIAVAGGAVQGLHALRDASLRRWLVVAVLGALPVINFGVHHFASDRSRDRIAADFVKNVLASVEPGGLLLVYDSAFLFPYLYARHVEGFRPDARVVFVPALRRRWYVEDYLSRTYPALMAECGAPMRSLVEDLRLVEEGGSISVGRVQARVARLLDAMVDSGLEDGGLYGLGPSARRIGRGLHLAPVGLTMKMSRHEAEEALPAPALELSALLDESVALDEFVRRRIVPLYSTMLRARAIDLARTGHPGASGELDALAARLEIRATGR